MFMNNVTSLLGNLMTFLEIEIETHFVVKLKLLKVVKFIFSNTIYHKRLKRPHNHS